jgi:hypothetical protein
MFALLSANAVAEMRSANAVAKILLIIVLSLFIVAKVSKNEQTLMLLDAPFGAHC